MAAAIKPSKSVRSIARPARKYSQAHERTFATGDSRNNTVYPQLLCPCFERIGNMQVICEIKHNDGKRELKAVLGPYWHVVVLITLPLILGFSYFISSSLLSGEDLRIRFCYWLLTVWVCFTLGFAALSDPGIVPYYPRPPLGGAGWPFSQQAGSYRPTGALFSKECNVIVEEYDHTCPWTGTAIGKNNIKPFRIFLVSLSTLLMVDILLFIYQKFAESNAVMVFGLLMIGFVAVGLYGCLSPTSTHNQGTPTLQIDYGTIPTVEQKECLEQDV